MKKKLLIALFLILSLSVSMIVVTGCNQEHEHTWATVWKSDATGHWHACTDSECVEKSQFSTHSKQDNDCTTEDKCDVCGYVVSLAGSHTPEADDSDCTTAIECSVCGIVTTSARTSHVAEVDDGDCTTAVTCAYCDHVFVEAQATHTPVADDGDCLTEVICSLCGKVVTPANASHTGGTATCESKAECEVCGKEYGGFTAHSPNADDGDCTTAITCSVCGDVTTSAYATHVGGTATCQNKAECDVCGTQYGEIANHVAAADDGDCTTAVKCVNCDHIFVQAQQNHLFDWVLVDGKYVHKCTVENCTVVDEDNVIDYNDMTFEEGLVYGVVGVDNMASSLYTYGGDNVSAPTDGGNYGIKVATTNNSGIHIFDVPSANIGELWAIDIYVPYAAKVQRTNGIPSSFNGADQYILPEGQWTTLIWQKNGENGKIGVHFFVGNASSGTPWPDNSCYVLVDNVRKLNLDSTNMTFEEGILYGVTDIGNTSQAIYAYGDEKTDDVGNYGLKVTSSNRTACLFDIPSAQVGETWTFDVFVPYDTQIQNTNGVPSSFNGQPTCWISKGVWTTVTWKKTGTNGSIGMYFVSSLDGAQYAENGWPAESTSWYIIIDNVKRTDAPEVPKEDTNYTLHNIEHVVSTENGDKISRVPEDVLASLGTQGQNMAYQPANAEIRFVMLDTQVTIQLYFDGNGQYAPQLYLYRGCFQSGWANEQFITLQPGLNNITIYKHTYTDQFYEIANQNGHEFSPDVIRLSGLSGSVRIVGIQGAIRQPTADELPQKSAVFYGSSITHGGSAGNMNSCYVSLVGRELGIDVYNKGLSGACFLESSMIDYIFSIDADFYVIEAGTNWFSMRNDDEGFRQRVQYILETHKRLQPDKKLFLIDEFMLSNSRHSVVSDIVTSCIADYGNENVVYIDGFDILTSMDYLSADLVHPSRDGYAVMAENLCAIIKQYLY